MPKKQKSKSRKRKSGHNHSVSAVTTVQERPRRKDKFTELLTRTRGASIEEISKATRWLPHSCRAQISSLRKAGHNVDTAPGNEGKVVYRIIGAAKKLPPRPRVKS
ncbi:MAG: DUF3489 domain-containing protein [Xanthobacteraceae bacterium]|nr:DUF3489 domain-containing protein [Xanthobacteraceae bacterium]QYK45635.1 MAG: DUF3489 domain-containing protein [Xanthobacteraceae bacterium]